MKKKEEIKKLELGAGDRRNKDAGWTYQDIQDLPGIELVCDAAEIDKHVPLGSVRQLRACHLLEHFGTHEVKKVLKVWNSVLKDDGRIYLEIPSLMFHVRLASEGRHEEAIIYSFGGQKDEYDFHKTGFTAKTIQRQLEDAGFYGISITDGPSMVVTAYKKKADDGHDEKDK